MEDAFERAFVEELRDCLDKLATSTLSGLQKAGGVASGLARVYESIAPSAAGVKALKYVTPRMDAHQLGRAAAKLNARHQMGFFDLAEKGQRSGAAAKKLLPVEAADLEKGASPLGGALRSMGAGLALRRREGAAAADARTPANGAAETDSSGLPGRTRPQAATSSY